GVVAYPVWLSLTGDNLNRDLVFSSQLDAVTLIDAGAIALDAKSPLKMVPVLTSSKDSAPIDLPTVRFSMPLDLSRSLKPDGKVRVLAALLTGKYPTAFPDGPPPPPKPAQGQKPEPPKPYTHPRLTESAQPNSVLVVGDADFIADRFSVQQTNFFGNVITQPLNDNLAFLLNSIEYLTGNQDLIAIRSRGQGSRPFTRLAAMRLRAAQQYQQQENLLSQRLEQVKKRLQELENQKQEGQKLVLTPAQLKEVSQFRVEEISVREQLRKVRRLLRQDIESLGNVLLTINLLAMPLLVTVVGFFIILRRTRRRGARP
ncbi:MAG TPA: ABC transporter, partial [bacterium]|nr:ABC transporter [bacterium]